MKKFTVNEFNANLKHNTHINNNNAELLDLIKNQFNNTNFINPDTFMNTNHFMNTNPYMNPNNMNTLDNQEEENQFLNFEELQEQSESDLKTNIILKFLKEMKSNKDISKIELILLYLLEMKLLDIHFDDLEFEEFQKYLEGMLERKR